jgi:hypothetical protein
VAHSLRMRAALAASLAVVALPLAACGTDDPGDGAGDGSGDQPSPSTSSTPAGEESADPSDAASSTVAPATGPLLQMPNAEYHAPKGWKKSPDLIDLQAEATSPDSSAAARLYAIEWPSLADVPSLEQQAATATETKSLKGKPAVMDPVEIGGVEWYHLSGMVNDSIRRDWYGTIHEDYQMKISFEFFDWVPKAEQDEIVASSLASFAWR